MATLATNTAGLPIFTNNAHPVALYNVAGDLTVATLANPGVRYPVIVGTGEPRLTDDSGVMPQPPDLTRVTFLVVFTSQTAAARAAVIAAAAAIPAASSKSRQLWMHSRPSESRRHRLRDQGRSSAVPGWSKEPVP